MKTCLVVGSLNMDYTIYLDEFPMDGETIFANNRFVQPGGKGANQAVALAKSNKVKSVMVGALGDDKDADFIKETLNNYGVIDKTLKLIHEETGNATICVDSNSENKIVIIKGANDKLTKDLIDLKYLDEADYVVLQNEISQATNEFIIREAKKRNKIVVYNPAPYREINEELFSLIDYFIPNEVELSKYSETDDVKKGIDTLLEKGVKNIIVTLGSKGSVYANKDGYFQIDAYKVNAVDTVAAGDTYIGYLVSGLASDLDIIKAMDRASYASSLAVSRKGSIVSIPSGEEVF